MHFPFTSLQIGAFCTYRMVHSSIPTKPTLPYNMPLAAYL